MANLHKRSVQEALNATVGGIWNVNTSGTAGSSANVNNSIHLALATMTSTLGIHSAVEIYFNFTFPIILMVLHGIMAQLFLYVLLMDVQTL